MTITSTNLTDIGYIEETVPGTTPTTPAFQLLPTTGSSLSGNTATEVSAVIRSDRMIDDLIVVGEDIGGSIEFELSYEPYKPLLISLLRGTTTGAISVSETDLTVTNATKVYGTTVGDFVADGVIPGMFIKIAGFANAVNNGVFRVVTVSSTEIVVDTALTLIDETGVTGTMDCTDHVKNAETNVDAYTFFKRVLGIASPAYFYYPGCEVSEASFNFEVGSILNATLGVMGLTESITTTPIAGSTYTAVPDYDLLNSVSSITKINLAGVTGATYFNSLNLNINNNINGAKAIGTLGSVDLAAFTLDVTGDMSLYFEDKTMYDFYKAGNSFSVDLVLEDLGGSAIGIFLPVCKFETLETPIAGKDNFFFANGSIRALKDSTTTSMISMSFID